MNQEEYQALRRRKGQYHAVYDHDRMRALYAEGRTIREIAEDVGCSWGLAWKVVNDIAALYGNHEAQTTEVLLRVRALHEERLARERYYLDQIDRELRRRRRADRRRAEAEGVD